MKILKISLFLFVVITCQACTKSESKKKIFIFDFDKTMCFTPEPEEGKVIFKNKTGTVSGEGGINALSLSSIPVIGNYIGDKTSAYALHDMMENNQGYDVVFYPQYDTKVSRPFLGLGFIIKKTKVKATARLARLN